MLAVPSRGFLWTVSLLSDRERQVHGKPFTRDLEAVRQRSKKCPVYIKLRANAGIRVCHHITTETELPLVNHFARVHACKNLHFFSDVEDHAAENGVVAANVIPLCVVVNTDGGEPGCCRLLLMVD